MFRYRALFDLASDAQLVTDPAGIMREVNRAAAALLGRPRQRLAGQPLATFVASEDGRRFQRRLARLAGGPARSRRWDLRLQPPGGPALDAALAVTPIPGDGPGAVLFLWTLRAVSRAKAVRREALRQRDRLLDLSVRCLRAKEEEARRIAHQLHDEAAQLTAAVHLGLDELARELPRAHRGLLARATKQLDQLEERLRELSHELRPTILDDLGLAPAIGLLADGLTSRTGIDVQVRGEMGDGRVEPLVEATLYRIVQEALANVARHARASRVRIGLWKWKDRLACRVSDDGIGLPSGASSRTREGGLGLRGIRERIVALGGWLDVRSSPGRGTELRVSVPLGRCS